MQNLGCTVFAFDPTVSHKAKLGNRIYFAQLGVSKTTGTIETNGLVLLFLILLQYLSIFSIGQRAILAFIRHFEVESPFKPDNFLS